MWTLPVDDGTENPIASTTCHVHFDFSCRKTAMARLISIGIVIGISAMLLGQLVVG